VPVIAPNDEPQARNFDYRSQYGETDLFEGNLRWRGGTYILSGMVVIAVLVCVGTMVFAGLRLFNTVFQGTSGVQVSPVPTVGINLPLVTNTPRPTLFLATVTLGPPTMTVTATASITPTQGPCAQKVLPNDSLIAIVSRCGHRSLDVIPDVLKLNNLADAGKIQIGQEILVPWPTATTNPNETPAASNNTGAASSVVALNSGDVNTPAGPTVPPTETLQPGVIWHKVQPNENIISIAVEYGANLKILSELNPEITFSQCDFGLGTGGPTCTVDVYQGQLMRVPAPTPAPTLSPTRSGSETPTLPPTPTFNAPSARSPGDRALFGADDLVTLRWVASGSLGAKQLYLVRVVDLTSGVTYTGTTQELYFIVPDVWHNQKDARHDYSWTVSVIDRDRPDNPYYTTEAHLFTWQGRGEKK
jgi:LysM repeat protein